MGGLPKEVQDAISTALVITGIALLIIGAILAFSGINIPLGVGMMVAGAALLWAAVGLNWQTMDPEMQRTVTELMGILSLALLVVGAILTFTGANPMLGVGLMIAGAAGLAALVALNWESMTPEMQQQVTEMMDMLGKALLVIGAILALTGAAAPLGVGLMIAGALLLGTEVALNWDSMSAEMQQQMLEMLGIIGGALIVVGIILICTGAGIGLGIACILAGIGMFVMAETLSPGWLLETVKGIWESICSWWDSNVAPIFTAEFWQGLWKSMVNGLIDCCNWAADKLSEFLNWVAGGINAVGGVIGMDLNLSASMPHIPHLAQGAVIPPNRKFAAVLGDQTSGMNLEAPEGLIRQIVREEAGGSAWEVQQGVAAALMQVLPALIGGESGGDLVLQLIVGNEELARAVNKGNASMARRGAVNPVIAFA